MAENAQVIAVGIVIDSEKRLLIAKRSLNKAKGGFWEFPGGKVEKGETPEQALIRELQEEIGIWVLQYSKLMTYPYDYSDYKVVLEVFIVDHFAGNAQGREGQEIRWVHTHEIKNYPFLEANVEIIEYFLLKFRNKFG